MIYSVGSLAEYERFVHVRVQKESVDRTAQRKVHME